MIKAKCHLCFIKRPKCKPDNKCKLTFLQLFKWRIERLIPNKNVLENDED